MGSSLAGDGKGLGWQVPELFPEVSDGTEVEDMAAQTLDRFGLGA